MHQALRKYFALHHHLALPGIGNFKIQNSPAQIDFINRNITPPATHVEFSDGGAMPDQRLYDFLSRELRVNAPYAEQQFSEFVASIKTELNEQKTVLLPGIGELSRQSSHVLNFQPGDTANDYFPVLDAERVIRKNAPHFVKVGEQEKTSTEMQTVLQQEEKKAQNPVRRERWWIPASILAFIGIVALILYYATHAN